jgi:hypothetical protein
MKQRRKRIAEADKQPPPVKRTKFPFRAVINGRPCTVSRFVGAYLFVYDDE